MARCCIFPIESSHPHFAKIGAGWGLKIYALKFTPRLSFLFLVGVIGLFASQGSTCRYEQTDATIEWRGRTTGVALPGLCP